MENRQLKMTHSQRTDRYRKINVRQFIIRLSKLSHPNTIEFIESHDNINGYIVDLIHKDMKSNGIEPD